MLEKASCFFNCYRKIQSAYEQCIELPRAIATSDGTPIKGTKSSTTNCLEKRYRHSTPPVILTSLQSNWTVIMEGMFLINIKPWIAHTNLGEYADFLIKQHIYPYYRGGSSEVHLLFDDPECQGQSPKFFERQHRNKSNPVPDGHHCTYFSSDMVVPSKWRENVLNCRKCKRNLVCFLSTHFLEKISQVLHQNQRFVTAGGFNDRFQDKAMFVCKNTNPQSHTLHFLKTQIRDTPHPLIKINHTHYEYH